MDQDVEAPPIAVPVLPKKDAAAPPFGKENSTVSDSNGAKVFIVRKCPYKVVDMPFCKLA